MPSQDITPACQACKIPGNYTVYDERANCEVLGKVLFAKNQPVNQTMQLTS